MSSTDATAMETSSEVQPSTSRSSDPSKKARKRQPRRYGNSKQKREDAFRMKTNAKANQSYRASQDAKFIGKALDNPLFSIPRGLELAAPSPVTKRLPVSTIGIGLAVSELYYRFHSQFRDICTIYQLYRVSLAQFEFQLHLAAQDTFTFYPVDFNTTTHFPTAIKDELRGNGRFNFKVIVAIIETVGRIVTPNYLCYLPPPVNADEVDLSCIRYTNLKETVSALATTHQPGFPENNSLPGAIVENGMLRNAQDFWPENYTLEDFAIDVLAVNMATESMRAKFDQVLAECSFSGIGSGAAFVCTSRPPRVPYKDETPVETAMSTVTLSSRKRKKENPREQPQNVELPSTVSLFQPRPVVCESVDWYSVEPIEAQMFALGILGVVGATSDARQITFVPDRIRTKYSACQKLNETWRTVFGRVTPRLSRT